MWVCPKVGHGGEGSLGFKGVGIHALAQWTRVVWNEHRAFLADWVLRCVGLVRCLPHPYEVDLFGLSFSEGRVF